MGRFAWSRTSSQRLHTCRPELIEVVDRSLACSSIDLTIICGYRSVVDQGVAYANEKTKIDGVVRKSKHNLEPSFAVDVAPWPIIWPGDCETRRAREIALARFYLMAGVITAIARDSGLSIRWGGNWDSDADLDDQKFYDLVHFEMRI